MGLQHSFRLAPSSAYRHAHEHREPRQDRRHAREYGKSLTFECSLAVKSFRKQRTRWRRASGQERVGVRSPLRELVSGARTAGRWTPRLPVMRDASRMPCT
jgi:hypothetical protein